MAQLADKRCLRQPDKRPQKQRHAFQQSGRSPGINSNAYQDQNLSQGGEEGQPDKYLEASFHKQRNAEKASPKAKGKRQK
jgi:hypothetical protein